MWTSLRSSLFLSPKNDDSNEKKEQLHRKRVAQILRYIATMQTAGNVGSQFSFVRTLNDGDRPRHSSFFQDLPATAGMPLEEDPAAGAGSVIFTIYDFQRLASLMTLSSSEQLALPFSFYTARSSSASVSSGNNKRGYFTGRNNIVKQPGSTLDSSCWLRLTRLTGADVPTPPPILPPVVAFLQSWLASHDPRLARLSTSNTSQNAMLQLLETSLTMDHLGNLTLPPTAPPKVQRWWRRYIHHRQQLALQRQIEPLYNHLFEWYQDSTTSDDTLDLIWGLGQAQMQVKAKNGGIVCIDGPLFEVRVEVELARDGALLVRPKEHAGVALNRHVLAAITSAGAGNTSVAGGGGDDAGNSSTGGECNAVRQLRQVVEGWNASDLSPGQPQTYIPMLKRIAVELSSGGTFQSSSKNAQSKKRVATLLNRGHLVVTDAWCVYSSPRPSAVWARDAWAFAEKLMSAETLVTGSTTVLPQLPKALKALTLGPGALDETKAVATTKNESLTGAFGWRSSQEKSKENNATVSSRPPLPLPTSDAQNRIAELLLTRNYPAVVCEGPPGTGKTHTIANIVCAYLCQGKRVLVTSKGAPALSVLRERLPDCVQELCVDVSKSESSGMRQLQQTVERLANKVAWVNTERELGKSNAVKANIEELEEELRSIDQRLGSNAEEKRVIVQTQQGQDLFETALELIETVPWLMKTIASWDAWKVKKLYTTLKSLVISPEDPMSMVDGFESPPSDSLISLAASKAGLPLSYLKNATKEALSKVPFLGNGIAAQRSQVQEQLDAIRINGVPPGPSNKKDWYLIFQRLEREKAIHVVCQETLESLFTREGWPRNEFVEMVEQKKRIREDIVSVFERASKMKKIAEDLKLSSKLNEALEIERLDKRRTGISSRIQTLAEELVAARVVAELSKNFSAEAQSALVKFAQVSGKAKFGKSSQSAKMTQRQRRKRQEYLDAFEKCVRYIPCWILTSSQISDYLPSECLFDLVVIDEASQSDVTVLPGMLRGRQWLIVGDGKQVSPTESFVAEEQIEMLKAAMPESPFEASMLPGHSFFDLCAQAFPTGRVILREHFRCAPEIISYSNLEFYNGNLVPLRLPTSKERLKPSLIDVRLPHGRKTGKINEQECNEIVNRIGEYIDSCTLLKKRSIGVISLVGEEQSRLIRGRLLDRVGPHKYKLHNILVGEPPSFQGAERDVVYLSMVCSPGSVVTQNQLMHAQRVNVALSRARDRMVLVRSLDTNHIPNEQDVKFSVLDFFERARYNEENAHLVAAEAPEDELIPPSGNPTMSPFRARAERLLVNLLEEEGFSTISMGIVWDNAICVEDAGNSGRRAAVCIEATGESQEEWKAMLEQQKSIERVGWKCMRVDAVSFLANYMDVVAVIKKFLVSVLVFPRERPLIAAAPPIRGAGDAIDQDDEDDVVSNEDVEVRVPIDRAQEQEEIVTISEDEQEPDDETEQAYLKPVAIPTRRTKQEEQDNVDLNRLGNGETAADYGNVADLGFLGAASRQAEDSDGDVQDDDDDDDVNDFDFAARVDENPPAASAKKKRARRSQPVLDVDLDDDEDDDRLPNPPNVPAVARARGAVVSKKRSASSSFRRRSPSRSPLDEADLQEKQRVVRESTKPVFANDEPLSESSTSDAPDATSSLASSNKRRRMSRKDKYSRDPKWSQRRSDQQDDISHSDYMEEVLPEQPPAVAAAAASAGNDDDDEEEVDSANDQEMYEEELDQDDDDDESYLGEDV